jgi:hypothetical protein
VPGYPDLMPVRLLRSIVAEAGRGCSWTPVAGTLIISNSLYGEWKAEALVEDEIVPCGATDVVHDHTVTGDEF